VKFNGKRNSYAFNHTLQFIQNVLNSNFQGIDEGILCKIFILTFVVEARNWCRTLPVASIHSWDQFVTVSVCKFDCYDYDQAYDEIEYLRKENESVRDFNIRFHLNCLKYDVENEPISEESLDCVDHNYSLPPIPDPIEINPSFVQFPSNINEKSNLDVQINHDEEISQSLENTSDPIQEDKSGNFARKAALESKINSEENSENMITTQQMQMSRLEQQSNLLPKNMSTQRYDQKPEIYDECNAQEFSQGDIFKCIISESHFSLCLDIFNDGNSPPQY